MFARVSTFSGDPEQIAEAVETFREQALPWMREATGFRGWIALFDREAGETIGITFWSDRGSLDDDVATGTALRDEIARIGEAERLSTRAYEVVAVESLALDDER
jgi:hypothetical protein